VIVVKKLMINERLRSISCSQAVRSVFNTDPPVLQLAFFLTVVISVCCKLLVASDSWLLLVASFMAAVIPLLSESFLLVTLSQRYVR
jgi:hypothetical protein